ncbi:ABC transporter permease [Candidatus Methylacidithermus pantelleriae]|nr:ABC transporter permease [Candidatus Methylacidithermus pantelleriae]
MHSILFRPGTKLMPVPVLCLLTLTLTSLLGPWLLPYDPITMSTKQLAPPSLEHWLGTDIHGRDLLARLFEGIRISLLVGLVGATVSVTIGVIYGAISGYAGGTVDHILMRLVDILYSLPTLLFAILLITIFEKPVTHVLATVGLVSWAPQTRLLLLFVALGCVEWLTVARVVRGQVLVLRELPFVHASRALGQTAWKIVQRQILPHLKGIVTVYLTLSVPSVILQESFLSFLGLGVQPPHASLGTLMADGAQAINPLQSPWWLLAAPGLSLGILLWSLNRIGEGLRDLWDVRRP